MKKGCFCVLNCNLSIMIFETIFFLLTLLIIRSHTLSLTMLLILKMLCLWVSFSFFGMYNKYEWYSFVWICPLFLLFIVFIVFIRFVLRLFTFPCMSCQLGGSFIGHIFCPLWFCVDFLKFSIRAFPLLTSLLCFSCWPGMNERRVAWLRAFHFSSCISTFMTSQMAFDNVCTGCNSIWSFIFERKPFKNQPTICGSIFGDYFIL